MQISNFRRARLALAAAAGTAMLSGFFGAPHSALAATYNWSIGTYVPGTTAPQPLVTPDVLEIDAGGNKFFDGSTFTNQSGTVNWTSDTLYVQNGATINNASLWDAQSDDAFSYQGGTLPTFNNTGTFRKSAGAGNTTIGSLAFVNSGTIDAQTGAINFNGGNVTFNAGSQFTGTGVVAVTSNASFNGSFNSANLSLQNGIYTGTGAVLNGVVSLTGGVLTGDWNIAAGQVLNGNTGGNKFLDSAALTNHGALNWLTPDNLYFQNGSTLDNQGTFTLSLGAAFFNNGGSLSSFTNSGTLDAAAGTTSIGNFQFINNGGTLHATGTINYAGGNTTFNAGTKFTGAGVNLVSNDATFNSSFTSTNLVLQNGTYTGGGRRSPAR